MINPFKKKPFKKVLCLDFDGVLHSYQTPWKNHWYIPDGPVEGALDFLYNARFEFEIHILSSRSSHILGRWAMKAWLKKELIKKFGPSLGEQVFRDIKWPLFKPPFAVMLDDRAQTFAGKWPEVGELLAFRGWTQK